MYYSEASSLMSSARSPERGKPLQNNTRLYERANGYAVQLHSTDVVTIHEDHTWTIWHGGWETVTTSDRIRSYSPADYRTWWTEDGEWYVRLHPRASDPEPPRGERTIPKPFTVADPGPEPVKGAEGCVAGQRHASTTFTRQLRSIRSYTQAKLTPNSRVDWEAMFGKGYKLRPHSTRSRDLVHALERAFKACDDSLLIGESIYAWDCDTVVTDYTERVRYSYNAGNDGLVNPTQCPHCLAFDQLHARWHAQMHGARWGRDHDKGYAQMCEWLEEFGGREEWQDAYITEFREAREANALWREWDARNKAPFRSPVTIDSNGQLTEQCSRVLRREKEAAEKRQRAYEREQRKLQREHEAREREQRQLQRFKDRVRRRRGQPVKDIAREAAEALASLSARLESNDHADH